MNRIHSWPNNTGPIIIAGEECFCEAMKTLLPLILSTPSQKSNIGITTASSWGSTTFIENLVRLLNLGCHDIIVLWSSSDPDNEWDNSGICLLNDDLVQKIPIDLSSLTQKINLLKPHGEDFNWKLRRLLNLLQSRMLYTLLSRFGHNAKADITNRFLAPVRMLLHAQKIENAIAIWESARNKDENGVFARFLGDVCEKVKENRTLYGHLGDMINGTSQELIDCLNTLAIDNNDSSKKAIRQLDQLMSLLTECRQQAGIKVRYEIFDAADSQNITPSDIHENFNRSTARRILIIDDDAKSWKPVFEQIQNVLVTKFSNNVEICVSMDAIKYQSFDNFDKSTDVFGAVDKSLPDFDLVLLDIYLGNAFGLDILRNIRERIMHLPVVLWTTSSDKELPSQAALANGFIFKKTATIESISDLITKWLLIGKSQRLWSLPNPFFDHALRDPHLREVALAFTKWTLRYMDCFHAVDHFYFKFFNDHGGRHILGVMDTAAKLLRPFLFNHPLLNKKIPLDKEGVEPPNREKENQIRNKRIFCLYIAILCHEFGMFPIYPDEESSDSAQIPTPKQWERLENMRSLHGIRGMLMLLSDWNRSGDEFSVGGYKSYLEKLISIKNDEGHERFVVGEEGRSAIALLVGYHQRCLDLRCNGPKAYSTQTIFEAKNAGAQKKVKDAVSTSNLTCWTNWDAVSARALTAWEDALSSDLWDIDSLRQMCAILRFADALDVDHTRVPADFLLKDNNRRSLQDVEDCKRQVLASVQIDQGIVSLEFYGDKPNVDLWFETCSSFSERILEQIPDSTSLMGLDKENEDFGKLRIDPENEPVFVTLLSTTYKEQLRTDIGYLVSNPWEPISDENDKNKARLKTIEKFLKGVLQVYFTYQNKTKEPPPAEEFEECILTCMAGAAALLVILEIKDEYTSITDVGIGEIIKLNNNIEWNSGVLPSILRRNI